MHTKYILSFLLFISLSVGIAQTNNGALAIQYFEQKEFEKANVYFEELFNSNPNIWYANYLQSLIAVKNFNKAEKIAKKQIKNNKNDGSFYVDLGSLYDLQNETKKAKDAYEKALKETHPFPPFIENLAKAFISQKQYDYAIDAYNKGKKATPDYPYFYERAYVYKYQGNLQAMVNEYLDAIEFRETELFTAQTNLQNSLGYDEDNSGLKNPILKQELQKRIQAKPDKYIFAEFLIYILKQQQDFDGAFVQSRALDKRNKENGYRIYDLAKICTANKSWATAIRCFEYLLEKKGSPYVEVSGIEILNVEYEQVIEKPNPTKDELNLVELKLQESLKKYNGSFMQTSIIKNLATLKAFYLNKPQEAITLMDEVIENPSYKNSEKSPFKILQADIYVLEGQIWDASLLYSQVEKDFKYEPIGHEAKFKNAKLSFYAGDFKWAKTQCDVLKGATTKLIANDALDLSLVITDAIGVDTNEVPLQLFASADLLVAQHKYQQAIIRLDSINLMFETHTLGDDIYFKKAQVYQQLGNYLEVEKMYLYIIEFYPTELYGDDAQFKLAELYHYKLANLEKAKETYEKVIVNYPGSIYVVEARKRYRELRGDKLNN